MTTKQKMTLREMYMVHLKIMMDYPSDTDRIEKGFILMENFIDNVVNAELGKTITQNTALYQDGKKKN